MTIVQQACKTVEGFELLYRKFQRKLTIEDKAPSTFNNYSRSLAQISLHYNSLPTNLNVEQVHDYLFLIKQKHAEGTDAAFKFLICSLRAVFRMENLNELCIALPVVKKRKKLPVVLSKKEVTAMMNIPCMLKHRVLIALLYGCGLRCGEVRKIKVSDIDLDRSVLHVRQSKGKRDRYIPIGKTLCSILEKYLKIQKPLLWLFSGKRCESNTHHRFCSVFEPQFGQRSIQWAVRRAAQLAGISKPVNVHSLRHTYATHLLEDGVNILSIKELLGHADIQTTMIYLHVAQVKNTQICNPLDSLDGLNVIGAVQGELQFR